MGRLPSLERKYQLQTLNSLHHEILRMNLIGFKSKEIANLLGVTEPTVCNVLNGAKGRTQLAILRGMRDAESVDVAKDIAEFASEAWEIAKSLIRDENQPAALRLKGAFDAIGVAGHVKPQRVQVQGTVAHLTSDEIAAIKARARAIATAQGIIDVEYVEHQPQGELPDVSDAGPGES